MTNQAAQTMPECTCRDNEGCTKPCARKACQPVPLTEELLIEAAILSGNTPQERRLQKVLTKAAAALSQTAGVVVSDEMIERACKKYAFREDGAVWPDAYSEHEVAAERTLMREFLEHVLAAAPAASGGEDEHG